MEIYTNTLTSATSYTTAKVPVEQSVVPLSSKNKSASSKFQEDRVILSSEGKEKARRFSSLSGSVDSPNDKGSTAVEQQEIFQIHKLKQRDTEVRTHEQAHLSAAGPYAKGGASFTYQKGADGKSYAVGGEVGIDTSKESTPEQTIAKMQTVKRAALAPANPSGADRRIASHAAIKESEARKEILASQQEEMLHRVLTDNPLGKNHSVNEDRSSATRSTLSTVTSKLAASAKMVG